MRDLVLFFFTILTVSTNALAQKVGIGTSSPIARLEVKGEGNNSTTNNLVLKNSDGDTLLRMRNDGRMNLSYNGIIAGRTINIGGMGVNFYFNDSNLGGAIFPSDSSMVLWSDNDANKYVILQPLWGKVGIGTNSPKAKFHVRNGNASGALPVTSALAVFEDNKDASINLLTPNDDESAIYFGNSSNAQEAGITFNSSIAPDGLAFRTNGNLTRAVISEVGNFGIGENSPNARLHVANGAAGGIYHSQSELIIEDNENAYIQFSNPSTDESGILSGNPTTSIRSALIFRADSSVHIRTGGNNTRITVSPNGDVGIGVTPTQKLHVSGNGLFTGSVFASCGVLACSDIRYKTNITPLKNSLCNILSLQGISYNWDQENFPDKNFNDKRQIGIAAQELETVFPEMVQTDSEGYKTVDYTRLTPVLVEAVKEQQKIITSQQVQLDSQQSRLESLEKEMQELKLIVLQLSTRKP